MDLTIFLGNVSTDCKEKDIYKLFYHFGLIKRIKIFYENYHDDIYPVGYAAIQFSDQSGYDSCKKSKKNITFNNCIFHIFPRKPETSFPITAFVFFSSEIVTAKFLNLHFEKINPTKIRIITPVTFDKQGFAMVEFASSEARDRALTYNRLDDILQVFSPSMQIIDLSDEEIVESSIQFTPVGASYFETKVYDRFLDLEIVHQSTPYRVNSFLASVHSSRIQRLLLANSILTRIDSRIDICGPFELIADCLLGLQIQISIENAYFVYLLASDFEIETLINESSSFVFSQLTAEKALKLHNDLNSIGISASNGPHIDFMSMNIDQMMTMKSFRSLSLFFIASVLKNEKLAPKNLQYFCYTLLNFISENREERLFLIQFLPLSEMDNDVVIALVSDPAVNVNQLVEPLLSFFRTRGKAKSKDYEIINCIRKHDMPIQGVFGYLCQLCNGNPHDFELINVSASSYLPLIIESEWDKYWSTPNMPDSWFCIDFNEYLIIPDHYSLKNSFSDNKLPSIVAWRIEGSNDNIQWEILDEQRTAVEPKAKKNKLGLFKKMSETNSDDPWRTFPINTKSHQYRYIKMTQIDKNGSGNHCMFIHGIEFFGNLPNQKYVCQYFPNKRSKGVFSYIKSKEGSNPIRKGVMKITSSCDARLLVDEKSNGYWRSSKEESSMVKIDLKNMRLHLTMYSLKCHYGPAFIKSWTVEVSDDDKNWIVVDTRTERKEYNNPDETYFWTCSAPFPNPIRYIKFTNTDMVQKIFWLSNIELFGELYKPKSM